MGWTYTYATEYKNGRIDRKAEMEKLINSTWSDGKQHNRLVRGTLKGSVYYAAVENLEDHRIWGLVCLTATSKWDFGYKDMSEDMLPFYFDCPKAILDLLSPTENENSRKWREACYENLERKKGKVSPGRLAADTTIEFEFPFDSNYFKKGQTVQFTKYPTYYNARTNRTSYKWITYVPGVGNVRIKQSWIPLEYKVVA